MTQLNRDDMSGLTPEEIDEAHEQDRFALMLGADPDKAALLDRAHDPNATLTAADLKALRAAGRDDLIDEAYTSGRLDHMMNGETQNA